MFAGLIGRIIFVKPSNNFLEKYPSSKLDQNYHAQENFSRRACSIFPFPIKGKRYQMKTRQRKLSISKPVIEFVYRERGDLCWKRVEGPGSAKSIDSMLFMKCLKGKFQQIYSISIHSCNDFRLIFQRITTQSQSRLEINTREVPMGKYFSDLAATEVLLTRFS